MRENNWPAVWVTKEEYDEVIKENQRLWDLLKEDPKGYVRDKDGHLVWDGVTFEE